MTVYVDDMNARYGRMIMCHMIADTEEELHVMAESIGMKREWFQPKSFPHYDVSKAKKALAIQQGAVELTGKQLVGVIKKLRAIGK